MNDFHNQKKIIPYLSIVASLILGSVTYLGIGTHSSPWCDELTFLDSAVNFLRTGSWHSEVFYLVNNPLYPLIAALATLVFGASHLTTVGINVLFAFLSSVVILRILSKRKILTTLPEQLLFVGLFWASGTFAWIATDGRPDTLVLLLTALLADTFFSTEGRSAPYWKTFFLSYLLMLSAAYTLPLCCLISLSGAFPKNRRKDAVMRTTTVVCGGTLAWLSIAAFYAWHHEIIRFVGFYASFNTITGSHTDSFLKRTITGYGYDVWPLAILFLSTIIALTCKRLRHTLPYCALLLAIPFLMTLCGRYQSYYSWVLSVSTAVLAATIFSHITPRTTVFIALLSLVPTILRTATAHPTTGAAEHAQRAKAFVADNANLIRPGETVLVADDTVGDVSLYYPLLQQKANTWFRGRVALTELSDRQKFETGLGAYIPDAEKRKRILNKAFEFQRLMPFLPERGIVLFASEQNRREVEPILRQYKKLTFVTTNHDQSLYTFE